MLFVGGIGGMEERLVQNAGLRYTGSYGRGARSLADRDGERLSSDRPRCRPGTSNSPGFRTARGACDRRICLTCRPSWPLARSAFRRWFFPDLFPGWRSGLELDLQRGRRNVRGRASPFSGASHCRHRLPGPCPTFFGQSVSQLDGRQAPPKAIRLSFVLVEAEVRGRSTKVSRRLYPSCSIGSFCFTGPDRTTRRMPAAGPKRWSPGNGQGITSRHISTRTFRPDWRRRIWCLAPARRFLANIRPLGSRRCSSLSVRWRPPAIERGLSGRARRSAHPGRRGCAERAAGTAILELIEDKERLAAMATAMKTLARPTRANV